jgi:hypothetical protein
MDGDSSKGSLWRPHSRNAQVMFASSRFCSWHAEIASSSYK